ncbi:SDR family NAD(P)-dependent oxidoreductase [Paraferrimonas sp. SM1919]|uniref:SDR family NAD(P)-dependent oxidoreductase n=1 Tax=Paraferrimonas sp. SM1919 TaxID=2662263 RepID=UPI0013D2EED0|nr:SDR family NAD(P)-dependent oxidoreductase [Paraferrimonas sp. SM1919]
MANKVAIVTGASKGIGQAIAIGLAEKGMHLVLIGRDLQGLEQTASQCKSAETLALDITDEMAVIHNLELLISRLGRVDVLINNAGVAEDQWVPIQDLDMAVLKHTFEINFFAQVNLTQQVLPIMKSHKYGRIVNISSELASLNEMQMGNTLAYRASKNALNSLTKVLSLELNDYSNIKVNSAAPGWVKTALGGEGAPLTPEQGADTAIWLATLAKDGPTGGFYREREVYPW